MSCVFFRGLEMALPLQSQELVKLLLENRATLFDAEYKLILEGLVSRLCFLPDSPFLTRQASKICFILTIPSSFTTLLLPFVYRKELELTYTKF
uniref:Uncharacterized protein n=1 Tax=Candidatus Kentrum sp. FW TaxID=2126338 RepID=A0A450TZV5_9GAMM|nr:MAG: hypothetical protein BECKFW1821C_GA0114237_107812 [Candidatus Kentron sp. FW]